MVGKRESFVFARIPACCGMFKKKVLGEERKLRRLICQVLNIGQSGAKRGS